MREAERVRQDSLPVAGVDDRNPAEPGAERPGQASAQGPAQPAARGLSTASARGSSTASTREPATPKTGRPARPAARPSDVNETTGRPAPLVEIRGLQKSYREGDVDHVVLDGADAEIRRGELVVLIGASGSGKSTLLNLISGIDEPDGGSVRIDGVPITGLRERERTLFRRHHIGFVFQFYNLIPTLTVLENLVLPLELSARAGRAGRRRALERLAEVGLGRRAGAYPDRLSGGEQQRVAIARALVHDPWLILADEPTGNLDRETGARVLGVLDRLTRRAGRTMLVATHSPDLVALADRVLAIRDGKLIQEAYPRSERSSWSEQAGVERPHRDDPASDPALALKPTPPAISAPADLRPEER